MPGMLTGIMDTIRDVRQGGIQQRLLDERLKTEQMRRGEIGAQTGEIKQRTEAEQWELNQKKQFAMDSDSLKKMNSAYYKIDKGMDLDDAERGAIMMGLHHHPYYSGKSVDEIDEINKATKVAQRFLDANGQSIISSMQTGKNISLKRSQDSGFFNALDKIYGDQVEKGHGVGRNGKKSKNTTIDEIYFDPRDGTMVLNLRQEDSDGNVDYHPATVGNSHDPNSKIIKIPVGLFSVQLASLTKVGDTINALRLKLGDKEFQKQYEGQKENARKSSAFRDGEDALEALLEENPKATASQQRNAYSKAAGESGILSQKEIDERLKTIIQEKGVKSTLDPTDLKALGEAWGEVDTEKPPAKQKQQFVTALAKRNISLTAEQLQKYIEDFKGKEAPMWKPGEKELKIRELDIKEKDLKQKKIERDEKEKEKPLSVTEQRGLNDEIFSRYSNLIPEENEDREDILKSRSGSRLIENLPGEHQETVKDIRDRATEMKQEDKKLTWNQAVNKAEKEIRKPQKPKAKPTVEAVAKEMKGKPKGKYRVEGHMGTWDGTKFNWISEQ